MLQFCSVLSLPASSGTIEFEVETYNVPTNLVFTISATGINDDDSEIDVAKKIYNACVATFINDLEYIGPPIFHDQEIPATFRAHRTDHVVTIYSQCQFSIKIINNDTGCRALIGVTPTLAALDEARNLGTVSSIDLKDSDGNSLTDDQLEILLQAASSKLIELLNNNIVICTYLKEFIGNGERAITLDEGLPGISIDAPNTRRPYQLYVTLADSSGRASSYGANRSTGKVRYRFAQGMIKTEQPFQIGNEFNITYVAGYFNIPQAIKLGVLFLAAQILAGLSTMGPEAGLKRLTGGNLTFEFFDSSNSMDDFLFELRAYII